MFDILSTWADAQGPWGYAAVAVAAATPWVEILLVIPPAIALGLDPVATASAAFAGNYAPVAAIVLLYDRIRRWRGASDRTRDTRRARRARRLLARYGVPGLAVLGPLLTGIHLATVLALATGASHRSVLLWTGSSLLAWTVGLTVASMLGLDLIGV